MTVLIVECPNDGWDDEVLAIVLDIRIGIVRQIKSFASQILQMSALHPEFLYCYYLVPANWKIKFGVDMVVGDLNPSRDMYCFIETDYEAFEVGHFEVTQILIKMDQFGFRFVIETTAGTKETFLVGWNDDTLIKFYFGEENYEKK